MSRVLEKQIYYDVKWSFLCQLDQLIGGGISSVSLLILCLLVLSITKRGALKFTTIIVDFSISQFSYLEFTSDTLKLLFDAYTFKVGVSSVWTDPVNNDAVLVFVPDNVLCSDV